ncbi:MAG: hypothetical protein K0U78_19655 [Actinomycetia bacterium]|nr:hypothetical protein [Actinomycetes bacterium]
MEIVLSVIQVVAVVTMLALAVVGLVASQTDRDFENSRRKNRLYIGLALAPFGVFIAASALTAGIAWQRYVMIVAALGVWWLSVIVVRRNRLV